jgi:DNA-binding transcriptional LysR family regulator
MNDHAARYPDWEPLMTWVAVVQAGSVSEAARRLSLSPAAVSQRIKQLETTFETTLLDRTSRPLRPTATGERLFEHALAVLQRADQMMEGVRRLSRSKRLVVRVGCSDSFAAAGGPVILRAWSATTHQIRLWTGSSGLLEESLQLRELDMVVTPGDASPAGGLVGISRSRLYAEPYVVVLPYGHTGHDGTLSELAQTLPMMRYSANGRSGKDIDDYLAERGDDIERTCEFETTDALLSMVANGLGFALTTPLCIWQAQHYLPKITVRPLSSFRQGGRPYPMLLRTHYVLCRENEFAALSNDLRNLIRQSFRRYIAPDIAEALKFPAHEMIITDDA